jgi:hypothetical protein
LDCDQPAVFDRGVIGIYCDFSKKLLTSTMRLSEKCHLGPKVRNPVARNGVWGRSIIWLC